MFPSVARSASASDATPGPKYSTNLPTTPTLRRISVTVRTRSVAVAPFGSSPVSRKPTTCGTSIDSASPSIAASASMPPTPQPSTPRPLIIVVCESVPTSVSGNATPSRDSTTRARYSRLTWWHDAGVRRHDLEVVERALAPAEERVALAGCARTRARRCAPIASRDANSSTCTEWSMTSSTGISGLIFAGSPPWSRIASRIAARSTTHGHAREVLQQDAGRRERDLLRRLGGRDPAGDGLDLGRRCRSRRTFSSRMRSVYGSRATSHFGLQRVEPVDRVRLVLRLEAPSR